MRLVVPMPPTWRRTELESGVEAQVDDDLVLVVGAVEPLPPNAQTWAERHLSHGIRLDRMRVVKTADREIAGGWPVSLLELEVVDEGNRVVERRLHALYRFLSHGCSAVLAGSPHAFERRRDEVDALLGHAQLELDPIVALSQVFAGLELVEPKSEPKSAAPSAPLHEVDQVK
jgi:hypothetical protein